MGRRPDAAVEPEGKTVGGKGGLQEKQVGELYCPPRISEPLKKKGPVGTSFDLQTGWGLSREDRRREMWRVLREERPEVRPHCFATVYGLQQAINWGRVSHEKRVH